MLNVMALNKLFSAKTMQLFSKNISDEGKKKFYDIGAQNQIFISREKIGLDYKLFVIEVIVIAILSCLYWSSRKVYLFLLLS